MQKYVVLEKKIGQTPLVCAKEWRAMHPEFADVPLSYAGRLDPMASGKLLILIGDECKKQTDYHGLDKQYEFSVLFGLSSDTGDVLGRLTLDSAQVKQVNAEELEKIATGLIGNIALPYPIFSSKTVRGKALHTWALEGKLDEVKIPTATSEVYDLRLQDIKTTTRSSLVKLALEKVNSIPPVTDERKAIGNDFRRADVRKDWTNFLSNEFLSEKYFIATFSCIASSGTYMRSLAEVIAKGVGTTGLAWSIHRTHIGVFDPESKSWKKEF